MKLKEIKSKVILKEITMTELSMLIKIERRTMYNKIKTQDKKTIEAIKKVLNS